VSGGGGAFLHPTHCAKLGREPLSYQGKTYEQNKAFPSVSVSRRMGYDNMWKFRKRNILFDFVGGLLYIMLARPLLTRCWSNDEVALPFISPSKSFVCGNANELSEACLWWHVCGGLVLESLIEIPKVTMSLIVNELVFENLTALVFMWFVGFSLVDSHKMLTKLVLGTVHAFLHVFFAAFVAVFVQWVLLALNTAGSSPSSSSDGIGMAMWNGTSEIDAQWIEFGNNHPNFHVATETIGTYTFGAIPEVLRLTFVIANSARTQTILHDRICSEDIPNSEFDASYLFALRTMWYWVLATPLCAIVFGSYLAFSVCVLEIHWNEGFSSLQSFNFKNFCRMRIDRKTGDLEIFAIGLEKTWTKWMPNRRRNKGLYPSRWRPDSEKIERPKVVDYLRIPSIPPPPPHSSSSSSTKQRRRRRRSSKNVMYD